MIFKTPEISQTFPVDKATGLTNNQIIHREAKMRLSFYADKPNKVFVEELDGLGNLKKSDEFEGNYGFWKAVELFENRIADRLGIREVDGFEVGMIVEIQQDGKKYKKGDIVVIEEVNADGQATRYTKLNKRQLQTVENNPRFEKLQKTTPNEFTELLKKQNLTLNDLDYDKTYQLGLEPNTELVVGSQYRQFASGETKKLPKEIGGGTLTFNKVLVKTDNNKNSSLFAEVFFEDGSSGVVPMAQFFAKRTIVRKSDEEKQIKKELSKREDYYLYNSYSPHWEKGVEEQTKKYDKIFDDPFLDLIFIQKKSGNYYHLKIICGITGTYADQYGSDTVASLYKTISESKNRLEINAKARIVQHFELGRGWSPRYDGLDALKEKIIEKYGLQQYLS